MDPLSATSKAAGWSLPEFSLEARRPRTSATTPALWSGPRPVPTLYRPPDEEKGRAFRSRTESASSSTLFGPPDPDHNKLDPVVQPLADALGAALFSNDADDDDLLDQFLSDRGAARDQDDSGFVEQEPPSWSPRFVPAPVLSSSNAWTVAIGKAVENADGNIQLSGQKLRDVPNAVWELSTLRSFTPSSPSSRSFARTQSVPASKLPSSPARRIFGRTATVAFGSPGGSASLAAAGAVPVVLMLSGNELTAGALSNALWSIPNLQVLSLRNNLLDTLPEGVGRLAGLRELSLAGNQLQFLPAEILELDNLTNLTLHPNPWLRPPPAPPVAPSTHSDGKAPSAARARRRKRVLGPLVTHCVVPSLVETCTRILLSDATPSPAPPISLSASTSSSSTAVRHIQNVRGGVEFVRAFLDQRNLFAPFHSTFYPPSSLAASSSSSSSSLSPATSFFPRSRQSSGAAAAPPPTQPFDPASHQCRSPAHPHDARVFFRPAVERLEWVSEARLRGRAAAVQGEGDDGEGEVRDVPVRWRGCGARCLDWLELDEEDDVCEERGERQEELA
ncbi:hypothetical protein JCM3775_001005 [Rhodotorula graminis]